MKVTYLIAFDAFLTHGTTLAAAQVTGLSQPMISRCLIDLESELGIKLFKRTKNQITPLSEAWLFHASVQQVLGGFRALKQEAHAIHDAQTGTIVVAAQHVFCDSFLIKAIARFKARHPNVAIRLFDVGLVEMNKMLDNGACDLAFGITLGTGNSARPHQPLAGCVARCLLPHDHPLASLDPIPLASLLKEPFVDLIPGSPLRNRIDTLLQDAPTPRVIRAEMRNLRGVCALVEQGVGVAIVDPVVALIVDPEVLVLRNLLPSVRWEIAQFAPPNKSLSRGATIFADYVQSEIAELTKSGVFSALSTQKTRNASRNKQA